MAVGTAESARPADYRGVFSPFRRVARSPVPRYLPLVPVAAAGVVASLHGGAVPSLILVGLGGGGAVALLWTWVRGLRARVAESRRLAFTDDLTGLGNRRRLLVDLERA